MLKKLFGYKIFNNPKSIRLITKFLEFTTSPNDIILDFFSGSATTAHAIMQLNASDNGKRKYIMVQLDEKTRDDSIAKQKGFNTIDEIGRKRIELAADKIKIETSANIDYGYKHFYVETPSIETIDKIEEFDINKIKLIADDMVKEFSSDKASGEDVILTTWLINDGNKFDKRCREIEIEGYKAYYLDNATLYLINKDWGSIQTEKLLNMIGNNDLRVNQIIVFGYSFTLESMRELEININNNVNNSISIIKRY